MTPQKSVTTKLNTAITRAKSVLAAAFVCGMLAACDQAPPAGQQEETPVGQGEGTVQQNTPPQTAPAHKELPKEQAVLENARKWWAALISRDYETAYGFVSPGIRSTISLEAFKGRVAASPMLWSEVTDKSVTCATEAACRIEMEVSYIYMGGQDAFRGQTMTSNLAEKWIKLKDEWRIVYGQ